MQLVRSLVGLQDGAPKDITEDEFTKVCVATYELFLAEGVPQVPLPPSTYTHTHTHLTCYVATTTTIPPE